MILETTSKSSAVNWASLKNKVTMTENHEELITKAAKFIRSDIEEYYKHCVKSVQIRSNFWSVFSRIRTEYGPEITPYLDTLHAVKKLAMNPRNWLPTLEELMPDNRLPPPSVFLFLTSLLKSSKHGVTKNIWKLVDSCSSDFIDSVSKSEVLKPKHFSLGISLHSITGQRKIVQIVNRLAYSIS